MNVISLEKSISGDPVVVDHNSDSQHSKTSILKFSKVHSVQLVLALSNRKSHWVKSKVSRDTVLILKHVFHGNISLVGPELKDTHPEDNLEHGRSTDNRWGKVGVIYVGVTRDGQELLLCESKGGKHGNTTMLDLSFAEPLHVKKVGESEGIEANISNISVKVGWCLKERNCLGHGVQGGSRGGSRTRLKAETCEKCSLENEV